MTAVHASYESISQTYGADFGGLRATFGMIWCFWNSLGEDFGDSVDLGQDFCDLGVLGQDSGDLGVEPLNHGCPPFFALYRASI